MKKEKKKGGRREDRHKQWKCELLLHNGNVCILETLQQPWSRVKSQRGETRFSSLTQSCPTLCDPMDWGIPGFPVHHQLPELVQTHVHWSMSVMPSNHFILCHPLLLLPSIFPNIRVFAKSTLHIRWPKYWSYSGLIFL